jgi:uncharacterized protein YndB with AHSA1/START domain
MKGIRHFLRDFTATAVREHLRSEIETSGAWPDLTKNEIELVRFIGEGSFDWGEFLSERCGRGMSGWIGWTTTSKSYKKRRAAVTPNRHGSSVIEFPTELEIVTTREFEAPVALVFDVLTKPEHVSKWFAPFECEVTECSIDLRVGGSYHIVFVTGDGTECSFRGTYLEVEPPTRTVETWLFDGWPDADAVESVDLQETDGVTKLTMKLAFRDKAGRDHMTKHDGQEDSLDKMEDYLRSLLDRSINARRVVAP